MDLNTYQAQALRTLGILPQEAPDGWTRSDYQMNLAALGLSGEAGEFTDLAKKVLFHAKPLDGETRDRLLKEIGDLLWYAAVAADSLSSNLDEIAEANLAKLRLRYPDGFTAKDSAVRRDVTNPQEGDEPPSVPKDARKTFGSLGRL